MSRTAIIVVLLVVVGAGIGWWMIQDRSTAAGGRARSEFFEAPKDYDTSGGQTMRTRWNGDD